MSDYWIIACFRFAFIAELRFEGLSNVTKLSNVIKRVICTLYIPVSTPKKTKHILRMHVRDENVRKREIEEGYKAATTGNYFLVRQGFGGLHITCPESSNNDKPKIIDEIQIFNLPENEVSFIVDTRKSEDDEVILQFIITQGGLTQEILVKMCLQESAVGETTQSQAIVTSQRPVRSSSSGIQMAPGGVTSGVLYSQHSSFQEGLAGHVLSDAILLDLSKQIDCMVYPVSDFAVDLGFDCATASAAELVSAQTMDPQRRYKIILGKFVLNNGRCAQKLIDAFKDNGKQLPVDLIIEGKPVRFAAGVNKNPVRLSQSKKLDFKKN